GDLAFMAQIKPAAREEPLALELVDLGVGKNAPVDKTAFRIDQRLDIHALVSFAGAFLRSIYPVFTVTQASSVSYSPIQTRWRLECQVHTVNRSILRLFQNLRIT